MATDSIGAAAIHPEGLPEAPATSNSGAAAVIGVSTTGAVQGGLAPEGKMSKWHLTLLVLASFGAGMAFIVPLSYTLALQLDRLAPGNEALLGIATGLASAVVVITGPLIGLWSDRMRSPLGRRRPFMVAGIVIGMAALLIISLATNVTTVLVTWTFANFGWGMVMSSLYAIQADRLPDNQRGKASGLTGMTSQIAPIVGIGIAYLLKGNIVLIFLVPGLIGSALIVLFLLFGGEKTSVGLIRKTEKLAMRQVLASYVFNPRKHPDFAWNLLGRFLFFMGLYANTTFSVFFYAQRLGLPVAEVAGTAATVGATGVIAGAIGAIGGGFLSDKLGRRKLFTAIGAGLFAVGAIVEAFAHSFPQLLIGAVIMNLAIAAFNAVDQAIVIAVMPSREEAGRFMAIIVFAQKIPSAVAPLIGSAIIGIGAVSGESNYTLLYLLGAAFAVMGGAVVLTKVRSIR